MKKFLLNLQLFSGGHSVTVVKDAGMTTASASSTTDVQANATVTLTLTPGSNKEIASVEVLSGGVTLEYDDGYSFKMGTADVVIVVKSKANNLYKIVENCNVYVNGSKTALQRNMTLEKGPNGAITGVTCTGTAVTLSSEIVANLVNAGVLIKI